MTPEAAERLRVYQEGQCSARNEDAECPYKWSDWRSKTWIKGRKAAMKYHEENIQARRTSEYWKAEHLAGNDRIAALEKALWMATEALEDWENYGRWAWPEKALEQAKHNTTEAIVAARQILKGKK